MRTSGTPWLHRPARAGSLHADADLSRAGIISVLEQFEQPPPRVIANHALGRGPIAPQPVGIGLVDPALTFLKVLDRPFELPHDRRALTISWDFDVTSEIYPKPPCLGRSGVIQRLGKAPEEDRICRKLDDQSGFAELFVLEEVGWDEVVERV